MPLHPRIPDSGNPPDSISLENFTVSTSFAQQRLWFLHRLDPQSPAYNMPFQVRLSGALDAAALKKSLNEIVRRHEPLRTTYRLLDDTPMQVIAPSAVLNLPLIDLSSFLEEDREQKAFALIRDDAVKAFDLEQDLVIRARLIRLATTEHILAFNLHHIAADGWSLSILFRELSALYQHFSQGKPASLPDLEIQYADFAAWQRQLLESDALEDQLSYWKKQLAGMPALVEFPLDRPRPAVQTFRGARIPFLYKQGLLNALNEISRKEKCSLFMTLLTAFKVLLKRCTGQNDIVVGSPTGVRPKPELENLIGCFVNTLVMRTDLSGDLTFREVLARVRDVTLDAYEHQDLPLDRLVEELKVPRNLGRNPLFQILFQFVALPEIEEQFGGLTMKLQPPTENHTAKFDLTFTIETNADGLIVDLEYRTDLFERATVERLLSSYQVLLEGVVQNPNQRIETLPLLSEAQRQQLLVEWNNTAVAYSPENSVSQLFEQQVEATPDAPAVIFDGQRLSYRELNERSNQLARYLKTKGVKTDTLVGVCLERSLEMVIAIFGVLKAGGAYVPLDPEYPEERFGFMLLDSRTPVLLTQKKFSGKGTSEHVVYLDGDWPSIAHESVANLEAKPGGGDLAYVIYTSGSTGQPKGVMISHTAICNHMLWMQERFPLEESDRVLQKTPFSFDASVWEFFAPLLAGAQLIIAKPGGHRDSAYLVETINANRITILQVVPSVLRVLLEEPEFKDCQSLRRIFCGGEALSADLAADFASFSSATLCNLYGPTEATIDATYFVYSAEEGRSVVPIGKPVANTQIYLLDEQFQPVPIGVAGELCIGGCGLARGYWRRPELTSEKFIHHPFSGERGARLYRTGDLARYSSDGNIEYVGRIDQQVKIRGFRIELGEIESVLRSFPKVKQSVVMAREDGDKQVRLVAYLVGYGNEKFDGELSAYLKTKLPDYMLPAAYVMLEELPFSPNGKIDRSALPAPEFRRDTAKSIAPRTSIEILLAQIWCEVLKLKEVGIHDNFFELGGHSLLATQVVSRMRKATSKDISLLNLFQAPTIAGLSALIENVKEEIIAQTIVRLARVTNRSASATVG